MNQLKTKRLPRLTLALLCSGWCALAQTLAPTQITGTLTNADGSNFSGTLQISWPSYSIGAVQHAAGTMSVGVTNGAINLSLWPTDAMSPSGVTYAVALQSPGRPTVSANWTVPSSTAAVNIAAVYSPPGSSSSGAAVAIGASLPSTCTVGQLCFNSAAAAGSNLFGCTAANTWTAIGGSSTRTWLFAAQGLCQSALAGAAIWLPASNAPVFNSCSGTSQQGEWTVAAGNTTASWGLQFVVPAGATGAWSLTLTWRTADTTTAHTVTLQPSYSCVASASSPDNPSYTTLSTLTLAAGSTASVNSNATLSFAPTCAAGSQFRLLLAPTANTFTSAAQFSFESVSLQAGY